jgi:two-component system, chemotaxis family, CheB/CheR fusion protein
VVVTSAGEGQDAFGDKGQRAARVDFPVVGVGASAGGLESLERLFSRLPANTGMAFVVLQHLSPDFKSLMDELLARRTQMRVMLAEHEMPVEPNCVYLLPPMKEMILRQRRLLLSDKDPRHGLALPIDLFLRSLAQDVGDRAIAVILSGSGSDGSRGILEVSRAGGVVFCETTDTAKFSGMPLSAIRAGVVDQVMAPEEIALAIAALSGPGVGGLETGEPSPEERGVDAILRLLRDEYAIDFSHYKVTTVSRRIERRLALNRSLDLDTYVSQLRSDPRELNSLYEDLLIGVTRFFRDDDAFDLLRERVIPDIVEHTPPEEQIRVWVPGCATGQEAYSIAMLFHEELSARQRAVNLKILATDVHKASLDVASAGLYTEQQVAGISSELVQRYFTRKPNGFQISQGLRESIVFAPHNLIRDAPFTKLDFITCRNLLIYFQPHAQKTVLTLFHFCLKPGGILFLGSSESPGGLLDEFDTIDERAKVYRKRRDIALPRDLKLPLARGASAPRLLPPPGARTANVNSQLLSIYDRLLDRFMPPSFLVDEEGQLVDTFGGAETLLKVRPRRPSQNLLDMLNDDLRTLMSGAMHRLRRDLDAVKFSAISIPGRAELFTMVASPIRDSQGQLTHIIVSFEADQPLAAHAQTTDIDDVERGAMQQDRLSREQTKALQEELAFTKENLQATIQELETTNEELQATNEELMASNEELQSTNEELHSVNEELYTVNAEYQKKNAELQELNDDIEHLLDRTDVGTLFLDRELCIRKFTPRILETFDIINQDLGRPLRSFSHRLDRTSLISDIEHVLRDGVPLEAQTLDDRGRCYFLRVLPYRARHRDREPSGPELRVDGCASDGVVVTLTDISALEQARARLAQLSAIVESSGDGIIGQSLDGIVTSWNSGAQRLYGYTEAEAVGRHVSFLYPSARRSEIESVLDTVRSGKPVERLETERLRKDGSVVDVSVTFSPIWDKNNVVVGVSAIGRDITQLVRARQEIADREERIRLLLDSTAEAIYGIDLSGVCIFCNAACARLLGYDSPAALVGKQMHPLIHHSRVDGTPYPPEQSPIYEAMRHRLEAHVDDEVLWRADGTPFHAEYWSHPICQGSDVIGAVVAFVDITERKQAEREVQEGVRRREQFLAMLSHELRNPLAAILSATRLLRLQPLPSEPSTKAADVVERQAKHMARLLDDLLDVSRITQGRIALRKSRLDLRETSRSALEALGPFMAERDITVNVDLPEEPVPVVGDSARLQQIQANLLSNAAKYSPRGSTVDFKLWREDGNALIRVTDRGRGIEAEVLPRIFELFVQGPQPIDRSDGGLGIGLTVLRSLVELHGGRVEAHSDGASKGSEFTVWLPLAPAAAAEVAQPEVSAAPVVKTVVVVEDQEDSRLMMKLLLESHGIIVFTAADGPEGLDLIASVKPDLALVDLGLPRMDGFEVAQRLRAAGSTLHLVALSGYGQESDVKAALAAGFDQHITKPPDPGRLEQLLAGRKSSAEAATWSDAPRDTQAPPGPMAV